MERHVHSCFGAHPDMKNFLYLIFVTPILWLADWYGKHYVGEEFPEEYGPVETLPGSLPENKFLDCPPTGSKEWEEWIDRKEELK